MLGTASHRFRTPVVALVAVVGSLAGCGNELVVGPDELAAEEEVDRGDRSEVSGTDARFDADDGTGADDPDPGEPNVDGPASTDDGHRYCTPEAVGDDGGAVHTIHVVVEGELGDVCYGEGDEALLAAWNALADVTEPEDLARLDVFAGYDGNGDVLAFAGNLGFENEDFLVAVDTVAGERDPDELRLTVVHEFAHVLTQTPAQLDVDIGPDDCDTYWNGLGCYSEGSYLYAWIDRFWSDERLFGLPEDGATDEAGGEEICELDSSFVGAYAASHPEEDFAETFSAYVFSLDVAPAVEPKLEFFDQYPELAQFRERAMEVGLEGLTNNFGGCG